MNQVLRTLLDDGEQFDPLYIPSMNTDHLPMTLVAMSQLGAGDEALAEFKARYEQRLRPVYGDRKVSSIAEGRGHYDAFADMRRILKTEIAAEGTEAVIRRYLPGLMPSLAAGAFHPLIRLGFALTAQHDTEVASALAYWLTSRFKPEIKTSESTSDLTEALQSLPKLNVPEGAFGKGLNYLLQQDRYPAAVPTTLEDCARTSLDVYLGTRNFFALHFVTGTQAARVCAPYVDSVELVAALSAAIQAGYLVVGAPAFTQSLAIPETLDEEHSLKYVYACGQEYRQYGDPRYLDEMNGFKRAGLVPEWVQVPD